MRAASVARKPLGQHGGHDGRGGGTAGFAVLHDGGEAQEFAGLRVGHEAVEPGVLAGQRGEPDVGRAGLRVDFGGFDVAAPAGARGIVHPKYLKHRLYLCVAHYNPDYYS